MINYSLANKHALICGGSQGIGKAIASEFASLGATVTLLARTESSLIKLKSSLAVPDQQRHHYLVADCSRPQDLCNTIMDHEKRTSPINILVNNSAGPATDPIIDTSADALYEGFNHHLICSHLLTQAILPGMIESGYGRIINILSTSVKQINQALGVSNVIRGAMVSWSKTLAMEVGKYGITVNNVLPGPTLTKRLIAYHQKRADKLNQTLEETQQQSKARLPLKRFAQPEEIAHAVCYLASPAAAFVTGVSLPVDGGKLCCI